MNKRKLKKMVKINKRIDESVAPKNTQHYSKRKVKAILEGREPAKKISIIYAILFIILYILYRTDIIDNLPF